MVSFISQLLPPFRQQTVGAIPTADAIAGGSAKRRISQTGAASGLVAASLLPSDKSSALALNFRFRSAKNCRQAIVPWRPKQTTRIGFVRNQSKNKCAK
jgi:hypothetical protein